ncbi:hypothetical protein [Nocardioides campestrisoli]|uniref:hypothetical protein n=1 Tax=Nocardioides campestrisoli TaxID=2736757 RepID=UPI00163D9D4A|nr:hypothetical protein [Nocardioides campestrisoli]
MSADLERVNPPVLYDGAWWGVVVVCLLAAVVVVLLLRRFLAQPDEPSGVDVEALRAATLSRLRELLEAGADLDAESRRAVVARLGAEVRRFLGTVSTTDLDYTTRAEWVLAVDRDPRLAPAVALLGDIGDVVFRPEGGDVALEALGGRAVDVVTSWR